MVSLLGRFVFYGENTQQVVAIFSQTDVEARNKLIRVGIRICLLARIQSSARLCEHFYEPLRGCMKMTKYEIVGILTVLLWQVSRAAVYRTFL